MINIDYCDTNNSYKKQVPMTASFLEGSSTTNRNKKLKIKSMINIDYCDSNYSYKKQAPKQHCFRGLINDKQEQEINYEGHNRYWLLRQQLQLQKTSADNSILLRGFLFLTKNSGRSVLHAEKGKSVFFDDSKVQICEWDILFKLFGYSMILIPFWQKKRKNIFRKN